MSPLLWIQRLFVPKEDDPKDEGGVPALEDDSPFMSSQHARVILAIAVALLSAIFMWWIVA